MGAVDLVVQVESAGGIARGLQRVGRAGHLVGRTSKGRMLAKTGGDLIESAALARGMLDGRVEALRVPNNCLDILTQQVIACVAVDRWDVPALFDLIRGAYPYRDLTPSAFDGVLRLASGRFRVEALRDLKPRITWDRVHNTLRALPGTKQLAVVGGGAIADTGQYPLYLGEGGPRLGELDEEFVLERRAGDTFVLGTSTWRITVIEPQKVVVAAAEGRSALMPFWRGEAAGRTSELGAVVGELCRLATERRDDPDVVPWLVDRYKLAPDSARSLLGMIARQKKQAGAVPDDRTVLVEAFTDPAGETGLAVLTPFGHRLHHALKLVLSARPARAVGDRGRGDARRRRHPVPAAGDRLAADGPLRRAHGLRRVRRDPQRPGRQPAVRPPVPPERRAGAAHAASRPVEADASLAPAVAGEGLAASRPQVPRFPDRGRDLPRMFRRRPRPAEAPRIPRRPRVGRDPGRHAPGRNLVAVHVGADVPVPIKISV